MKFIGQQNIWRELEFIVPEMQRGRNLNLLFRAPSGYGKTKLAIIIANSVNSDSIDYNIPDESGEVNLDLNKRIVIIDEVHTLIQPEILYPLMDSGRNSFFLCSNEFGVLKEPLVNRCINLTFELYNDEELKLIARSDFNGLEPNEIVVSKIVENSNGCPRTIRQLVQRLAIIFRGMNRIPDSEEELSNIFLNILQLENGLNPLHRRYLEYLKKVQRASLDSIIFATRLDRGTILKEIEPVLTQKDLISITSRGRIIKE